jgi:hypothetical protein
MVRSEQRRIPRKPRHRRSSSATIVDGTKNIGWANRPGLPFPPPHPSQFLHLRLQKPEVDAIPSKCQVGLLPSSTRSSPFLHAAAPESSSPPHRIITHVSTRHPSAMMNMRTVRSAFRAPFLSSNCLRHDLSSPSSNRSRTAQCCRPAGEAVMPTSQPPNGAAAQEISQARPRRDDMVISHCYSSTRRSAEIPSHRRTLEMYEFGS